MNGFRMPRKEVELFLEDLHSLLSSEDFNIDQDLWISYRNKNRSTILALNYSREDICKRLLELTISDYYETVFDSDAVEEPKLLFVFGKEIQRKQIYIKLKITENNRKVICISFHKAEEQMAFPYK